MWYLFNFYNTTLNLIYLTMTMPDETLYLHDLYDLQLADWQLREQRGRYPFLTHFFTSPNFLDLPRGLYCNTFPVLVDQNILVPKNEKIREEMRNKDIQREWRFLEDKRRFF